MHDLTSRTDTLTIPIIDGEVVADTTREIRPPWTRPPVTATYRRESRLVRRARMLARSPFARHLTVAAIGIVDATWYLLWTVAAGIGLAAIFLGFGDLADSFFRALGQ